MKTKFLRGAFSYLVKKGYAKRQGDSIKINLEMINCLIKDWDKFKENLTNDKIYEGNLDDLLKM